MNREEREVELRHAGTGQRVRATIDAAWPDHMTDNTPAQLRLDDLERIAKAATPGPWALAYGDRGGWGAINPTGENAANVAFDEDMDRADADHIATFDPPTVLALIARVRRAEDDNRRLVLQAAESEHARKLAFEAKDRANADRGSTAARLREAKAERDEFADALVQTGEECDAVKERLREAEAVIERARKAIRHGSGMDANPTRMAGPTVQDSEQWWASWHIRADAAWRANMTEALAYRQTTNHERERVMGKIKVEMLTERKIIDVRPGILYGYPDRIEVDVCVKCGSVVFDVVQHDTWHRGTDHENGSKSHD